MAREIEIVKDIIFNPDEKIKLHTNYAKIGIETDREEIIIAIENTQEYCENWNFFVSDSVECFDLLGCEKKSTLEKIQFLKEKIKTVSSISYTVKKDIYQNIFDRIQIYEYKSVVISVMSADGNEIQFALGNIHNGYYPHDIIIEFVDDDGNQIKDYDSL